jgi:ribosome biogenesis GTPase
LALARSSARFFMSFQLSALGWDESFADSFQPHVSSGLVPARVALEHKHVYELLSPHGALNAHCTGRLLHASTSRSDLPAVGDWVAVRLRPGEDHADIHVVLPRRSKFSRRAAGDADAEQIVAANIDTVFLVAGLDRDFNLRRIERYLAIAWDSGAQPVIVLNKADLHLDPESARSEVAAIAPAVPVIPLSAARGEGLDALAPWLGEGRTIALLGSSGAGKSTLVNALLGETRQLTNVVSDADGKGRHTTTRRELIVAPDGTLVIDTPGMRELQLWDLDASALETTFDDVATIARGCRFADCRHDGEPGCAIRAALEDGSLAGDRWRSFLKLQREQAYAARRADPRLARASRDVWKRINRAERARRDLEERG